MARVHSILGFLATVDKGKIESYADGAHSPMCDDLGDRAYKAALRVKAHAIHQIVNTGGELKQLVIRFYASKKKMKIYTFPRLRYCTYMYLLGPSPSLSDRIIGEKE